MLISISGSAGLGRVVGVPADSPAALVRIVAERPDQRVLVLAPRHAADVVHEQARLLAAARSAAQVDVLVSHHHALTLTLVADRASRMAEQSGTADVAGLLEQELRTARSLVHCPSAWRLGGTGLTIGQRLKALVGEDFVLELGGRTRLRSPRQGWADRPGDQLYAAASSPELPWLAGPASIPVDTDLTGTAPYGAGSTLLTVLPGRLDAPQEVSFADLPQESEAA